MEVAAKNTTQDAIFRSLQALAIVSGESLADVLLANEALMMNMRLKNAQTSAAQDPHAMPQSEYAVIYHGYHAQTDSGNGFVRGVPVTHPPGVFTSTRAFLSHLDNGAQLGTVAKMAGVSVPGAALSGLASVTVPQTPPENHAPENRASGASDHEVSFMDDLNETGFDNLVIDAPNSSPRDENNVGYDCGGRGPADLPIDVADGMARDFATVQPLVYNPNMYGFQSPGSFVADERIRPDGVEYFQYDGDGEYGRYVELRAAHDQPKSLRCHLCSKTYKVAGFLSRHLLMVHGLESSV